MDPILQAVLASSVVSTGISVMFSAVTNCRTETRQKNTAAQMLARQLEGYAKKCGTAIETVDIAVETAQRRHSYDPLNKCSVPDPDFDLTELNRLDATWRDRIAAFPDAVAAEKRSLAAQWQHEDPFDFMDLMQEVEAELGQSAFILAEKLRKYHALPTEHAAQECGDALNIFSNVRDQKRQREERMAENNASLYASMSEFVARKDLSHPASNAEQPKL